MRISVIIFLLFSINHRLSGQVMPYLIPNVVDNTDSTRIQEGSHHSFDKKKVLLITGLNLAGYGAVMYGLNDAWYKDYPRSSFHSFNDWDEWMQMDKFGHMYSAYTESKASMEMWRWAGLSRKKRIWLGGMSGAAYQTVIEILDGYCSQWGWSWGDIGANLAGSGLLIAQELAWDEQRIQLKWSFHHKNYSDSVLNNRSRQLFGSSSLERMLKDYNGQTYWLSFPVSRILPRSHLPSWLQISIGTGVENVWGARSNFSKNESGEILFDRTDLRRYRQWYLSPDIDLSKIKTRKKGIKLLLQMASVIKIPAPAMLYGNGKFSLSWLAY